MGSDTNEVIDRPCNTMLQRFQKAKETSFERESEFIFENVDLLYYYFHKVDMKRSGSYIKTPEWLKNKKAIINLKNINDDHCFQYSIPVALDHKNIGRNRQRTSKIKPFITEYNWNGIEFPVGSKDWEKFEQNNKTNVLNILYVPYKTNMKPY